MEKEEFRKKLLEEIDKTEKLVTEYTELNAPISPDNAIGRISRMDAINNKTITDAALRNAQNKLNKLNEALDNIDKADFGLCRKCKTPIPEGRILLKPESPFCVNCA